jgi:hypothetical protein
MKQKSTTFTTNFYVKKCYFHYDFVCKKVLLSLRYAKNSSLFNEFVCKLGFFGMSRPSVLKAHELNTTFCFDKL